MGCVCVCVCVCVAVALSLPVPVSVALSLCAPVCFFVVSRVCLCLPATVGAQTSDRGRHGQTTDQTMPRGENGRGTNILCAKRRDTDTDTCATHPLSYTPHPLVDCRAAITRA